jgi:hypothetical protein
MLLDVGNMKGKNLRTDSREISYVKGIWKQPP